MDIVQQVLNLPDSDRYVAQHGLGGYLFHHLPIPERTKFEKDYLQTWHINQIYQSEFNSIKSASERKIIKCQGLKGIFLAENIYQDLGLRKMSDIDILTDDLDLFEDVLISLGYQHLESSEYKRTYSKMVEDNEVAIESHSRLYQDKKIQIGWDKNSLSIFEHFYFLIYHMSYQHTFLRLNWFVDICEFLKKHPVDMRLLLETAKHRGHERSFLISFYFLNKFFKQNLHQSNLNYMHFFDVSFLIEPQKNIIKYYFLKHLTKDKFSDALKYDFRWFLNKF